MTADLYVKTAEKRCFLWGGPRAIIARFAFGRFIWTKTPGTEHQSAEEKWSRYRFRLIPKRDMLSTIGAKGAERSATVGRQWRPAISRTISGF